jgi:hypothetical protein
MKKKINKRKEILISLDERDFELIEMALGLLADKADNSVVLIGRLNKFVSKLSLALLKETNRSNK